MDSTEIGGRVQLTRWLEVPGALVLATVIVSLLEEVFALRNAESVYLVAVAGVAIRLGTWPATATAVGAFLTYNLLFIEPRITLAVARLDDLLTLLLLLFVGTVIGRLAGHQRDRERFAQRREREARALFAITRELATAHRLPDAMRAIVERISLEGRLRRAWIGLGPTHAQERIAADTGAGEPMPGLGAHAILRRDRHEGAAVWTRIRSQSGRAGEAEEALYRIELRAGDTVYGSLWCLRDRTDGDPRVEETRLIAAAADQVAQAVRRERLAARAAELEVERRSDELRGALLDSVSHDLRTPLASIRAVAGGLADPRMAQDPEQVRSMARSIDQEAERLNRLVGGLLDMSRIHAGALVAEIDVIPLSELVEPAVARMRSQLAGHPVAIDLPDDLPSVRVDATFLTQALSNLLDNAARHTPPNAQISIRGSAVSGSGRVVLVVEDGGAGVTPDVLPHLFERFYRGSSPNGAGARRGFGLGLTVAQGLVAAMGGTVGAHRSPLGGLAITLDLPADPGRS